MKFRVLISRVGIAATLIGSLLGMPAPAVFADDIPQLVIQQFKVTSSNGQFVTLYNQTDSPLDLTTFELDYTSSSNKTSTVPLVGTLPSHYYYVLADDAVPACYRSIVNGVSLGFTTTSGSLRLWQTTLAGNVRTSLLQDTVSWLNKNGNPATSPLQLSSVAQVSYVRQAASGDAMVTSPGDGTWENVITSTEDPCDPVAAGMPPTVSQGVTLLSSGPEAPATIVNLADDTPTGPVIPATDAGLSPPQITELLPNPAGTGTDGTDEFIELYNPNDHPFDLSGFILQAGLTTKHKYTFPVGTNLPAKSFRAFYSADTRLSLSNTSGEADLLDPFGTVLSSTDPYGSAKDGRAWALAKGTWYWTVKPTPGAANVINQATATSIKTTTAKKAAAAVKGATTTAASLQGGATTTADAADAPAPLHPFLLAGVAALAVGYGVYEYRHDLGNRIHQFRANRAARRKAGP